MSRLGLASLGSSEERPDLPQGLLVVDLVLIWPWCLI